MFSNESISDKEIFCISGETYTIFDLVIETIYYKSLIV